MDHTEALDEILSKCCSLNCDANGVYTFRLDLHCNAIEVKATLKSTYKRIQYNIVSIRVVHQ